jgi:hypothetical protein
MIDVTGFEAELNSAVELQQKLIGARAALLKKHAQKNDELKDFKEQSLEIQKSKAVLDELIKKFIGFQLDRIKEYVSYGLKTVISDQDITFDCQVTTKMNKPWVDLLTVNKQGISENALEAFGGSVAQIESLILRVLAILQLKLYPILILDESLNAVSEDYLPATSILLKELTKQLGIKILLVTHNKAVLNEADRVYRAVDTRDGLKFEEIKQAEI